MSLYLESEENVLPKIGVWPYITSHHKDYH